MLRHYIKIALRTLGRNRGYAFINVAGLAVGLACCLLIFLFVQHELRYDRFHEQSDRIYRVYDDVRTPTGALSSLNVSAYVGPGMTQAFPEVEAFTRLARPRAGFVFAHEGHYVEAANLLYADSTLFDVFSFPLRRGNPKTALAAPFSIVLTETLARQLFDDVEPMGKRLRTGGDTDLTVTGILQDLPANTHLEFDALGATATLASQARANRPPEATQPIWLESWQMIAMPTYARFAEGVSAEGFDDKFTALARDNAVSDNFDVTLQRVDDIHLQSTDIIFDPVNNKGDINNVYIFAAIALLILLIAVVNYMNLATARSTDRAKEVGMRKVVGAPRSQLVIQFLSESLLTTWLALILAVFLAWLALPLLNTLSGANLAITGANAGLLAAFMVTLVIVVGFFAGLYPAFVLARFKPITVLKGSFKSGKQGRSLRIGLVVFQFALSIALIGTTAIVQKQLHFIQTKDIGYDREQVVLFDMLDQTMGENLETFREALGQHSSFVSVAATGNVPGRTFGRTRVRPENVSDEDIWIWSALSVSPETLPTLGMEIVEGRNFSRERGTDSTGVVLINAEAARQLGWDDPLQRRIYFGTQDSVGTEVIGVVKDFHFADIHQNIEPVVIFPLNTNPGNTLAARIQPGRISDALAFAEQSWREVYPDYPFTYTFLDAEFDALYTRDQTTGRMVNIFSMLAILIACLGLFGLASHSTAQRTKEIGVRKVLGASSGLIIRLLVMDFVRWVALANLIAWPLAWYFSAQWLNGFAYRISVDPLLLLLATVIALVVSVLTVLGQSWRAAIMNPARALRYE